VVIESLPPWFQDPRRVAQIRLDKVSAEMDHRIIAEIAVRAPSAIGRKSWPLFVKNAMFRNRAKRVRQYSMFSS
jgi:hypothetical protein